MTDDELRRECEVFIDEKGSQFYSEGLLESLLAFARRQRAAGLREAYRECVNRAMLTGITKSQRKTLKAVAYWCEHQAEGPPLRNGSPFYPNGV